MKNRQVLEIHQALQRLDGTPSTIQPGIIVPFRFSAAVAYAIAKNLNKTAPIVKDIEDTQQRLLKALLKPGEIGLKKGDPRIEALNEEYGKVLDLESDYEPHRIKLSGLNIGVAASENQISPSVIGIIDPLIIDDSQPILPETDKK